ncbi:MAG: phosphoribosylglycinamide formyltransferase, partial [Rhodospirillaceae bacterium]|nr:phosphoribosylglycinamide formyltransferase [Rhodospirillaceae bacterium]
AAAGVRLICLAGFMRLLSPEFCQRWRDSLINIHPSLLPSFKGLNVHERMLEAGVRIGGCTVHYVRPEMDEGPILVQAAVPIASDDTPDTLAARILKQEHRIYPLAVRLIAEGRARPTGGMVTIDNFELPDSCLINPPL